MTKPLTQREEWEFVSTLVNKSTKYSVPQLDNETLTVEFSVKLHQLVDMDEKQSTAIMRLWLHVTYVNPQLKFEPSGICFPLSTPLC